MFCSETLWLCLSLRMCAVALALWMHDNIWVFTSYLWISKRNSSKSNNIIQRATTAPISLYMALALSICLIFAGCFVLASVTHVCTVFRIPIFRLCFFFFRFVSFYSVFPLIISIVVSRFPLHFQPNVRVGIMPFPFAHILVHTYKPDCAD